MLFADICSAFWTKNHLQMIQVVYQLLEKLFTKDTAL